MHKIEKRARVPEHQEESGYAEQDEDVIARKGQTPLHSFRATNRRCKPVPKSSGFEQISSSNAFNSSRLPISMSSATSIVSDKLGVDATSISLQPHRLSNDSISETV
jgi:hypothetical protein